MIRIKKVLYVLNDDVYVNCDHDSFVVRKKEDDGTSIPQRVPVALVEQVVIFGNITISNYLVKFCSENGIQLSYVSVYGNYYGSFIGTTRGNVRLRKKQYELYDDEEKKTSLVKNFVLGKLLNMISTLEYFRHDASAQTELIFSKAITQIKEQAARLESVQNADSARGVEGVSTGIYFGTIDYALKNNSKAMQFERRSRRPPENNFNACLSFLYTMLDLNCTSALETFGLDSYLGYLHEIKPGRHSLSNDLIEEFRAPFVDRFVVTIVNRKQITEKDFENREKGIVLTEDGKRKLLSAWEDEKEKEVQYPLLGKKVKTKIVPYLQAQLLSQFIRGDIPEYPPFHWEWR